MTAVEVADLPSADASTGRVASSAPLAAAGPGPLRTGPVRPSPHRQRLSELDELTDALRDGTEEMGRRWRAVLAYLTASGGSGAELGLPAHNSRASGRTGPTPVPGPAATT